MSYKRMVLNQVLNKSFNSFAKFRENTVTHYTTLRLAPLRRIALLPYPTLPHVPQRADHGARPRRERAPGRLARKARDTPAGGLDAARAALRPGCGEHLGAAVARRRRPRVRGLARAGGCRAGRRASSLVLAEPA